MTLRAPCLGCATGVDVPLEVYIRSEAIPARVRKLVGRVGSTRSAAVICRRCSIAAPALLDPPSSRAGYALGTGLLGVVLIVAVLLAIVYPRPGQTELRWADLRWPATDSGLGTALAVLATVLLAMGVDLAQQQQALDRLESPWLRGGRGLDLEQFRQVGRVMDRADLSEALVSLTSAAALAVGVVALIKGFLGPHVESVVTALVATIVVVVGRALLIRTVRASREDLGLTRAGTIIRNIRERESSARWQERLARVGDAAAWPRLACLAVPLVLIVPASGMIDASLFWRWPLAQVAAAFGVGLVAFTYAESIDVRSRALRVAMWSFVALVLVQYPLVVLLLAARTFHWFGWAGIVLGFVLSTSTFALAASAALPWAPSGGGLIRIGARRLTRYAKRAALPQEVCDFYVIVSRPADVEEVRALTRQHQR